MPQYQTSLSTPHLTPESFAEVCDHFDRRYCQSRLGSTLRQRWKLRQRTALNAVNGTFGGFTVGPGYRYLQIVRSLAENNAGQDGDMAELLGGFSFGEGEGGSQGEDEGARGDDEMMRAEEDDREAIVSIPSQDAAHRHGEVVYEIHYHPTYSAPCLWLNLHGLPDGENPLSIDTVFSRLVPSQYWPGLQGGIGGISMDHHPVTGEPSFFVHPCYLADAMDGFPDLTEQNYLVRWLGLVGGCVGLWVPMQMIVDSEPEEKWS
ncbi:hypothetical protein B0J18DRAFT_17637 [Chaetomium sp. MPI-SDFR-AT-0129]|nr:hypothetical protein B0J18DRAFT_17637 [Chaetomium sp. MPI-SDFR-AT-0129]